MRFGMHRKAIFVVFCLLAAVMPSFSQAAPVALRRDDGAKFRFIVYGDTRFTDPANLEASNAPIRKELVAAIARAHPAFLCIGGDIVYTGDDANDWKEYETETSAWREQRIPVYPALGNHEVKNEAAAGIANYFREFPALQQSRYYSLRDRNVLILTLDTNGDVSAGPQADWLNDKLDHVPADVDLVILIMHHPPLTTNIDKKDPSGAPAIRAAEAALARRLEERQKSSHARFVVVAGHVHNYERHERNGVIYFVSGGGAAHAYPIRRDPNDLYPDDRVNYHYLLFELDHGMLHITMNRVEIAEGKPVWTTPDSVTLHTTAAAKLSPETPGRP